MTSSSSRAVTIVFLLFGAALCHAQVSPTATSKLEAPTLYEKAAPSVVLITCVDAAGHFSQGSGVILNSDGVIATNYHVISDANAARVQLNNGDIYDDVSVIDTDERKDIAILRIKAINLPVLPMADSDSVRIGATVYAIGAPRGLNGSLSSGIVSSLRSASEISPNLSGFRIIQFTAPVSPGSSGGPLIDESGKLLGLVFATRVDGQNINLAVPVNYVIPLINSTKGEARILKRMPNIETLEAKPETTGATVNDIAGTYTGTWQSDDYNVYGSLVMTVSVLNGEVESHVALTGSEYIREDNLIVTLTPWGAGVWKMDYKLKKSKATGSGLFKNGKFVGDYRFKKFLWVDHGKWILQKN
jgi:S1-C subfamily serine protease